MIPDVQISPAVKFTQPCMTPARARPKA